jgi:hypothetical protein
MKSTKNPPVLDRLLDPLGECLTPETACRIVGLKADRRLQSRVNYLAERSASGTITPDEQAEYENYVSYGTFVAILKSKARQLIADSESD